MPATLEQIVQRMIDAGESEDNIAAVIKEFKASPPVDTPAPITTPQQSFRPGNIDLARQPRVPNPQGGTSTVFSRSFNIDGKEILLPSVTPDGRFLQTDDDVINEYKKSGLHLGEFPSPEEATKYATQLHADYEAGKYNKPEKRGLYEHIFEAPEFVTDAASRFAESITEPVLDESPWMARAKGFLGGAAEGAASLLSPANILTMGRGRLPQLASQILGGAQVIHGASDFASGDYSGLGDIGFGALGLSAPKITPKLTERPPIRVPEPGVIRPKAAVAEEVFDPSTIFGKQAPDEVSGIIKEAGLSSADIPLEVVDDIAPKVRTSPQRQAAMDARNPGFRGTQTPEAAIKQLDETNQIAKMANESQKKSLWQEVRDANRALLTSFDFSAAGRQGKPLMMTKAYWTSFDDMFKSWGSQKAYDNVMESINELPSFKKLIVNGKPGKSLAERAGLDIGGKEETFKSNFAENLIPGVKRSERAYSAFLNKLRADHFDTMVRDARRMGLNPDKNDVVLKQIGSFINDATGRGGLGKLERAAPVLNEVFFAPRLMASRVNMYRRWLNPRTYGNENPAVRKQALKSLISTVGFGTAVGELARQAGAQVTNDPTSSDFRKIKIGNTRIDPFSGFQQYAVGVSRLLGGELTSSRTGKSYDLTTGKFGMPSRASVASQFFQNKLAPIPSLVWSWMEGKDWSGEPFEVKKAILDRTVPIVMQDLYELQQEDPKLLPLGILPIMGEGIQTYGR